jgi:hypothetical protein
MKLMQLRIGETQMRQVGVPQFSYVDRNTWSGVGGELHGMDGMIFASFRYYLP